MSDSDIEDLGENCPAPDFDQPEITLPTPKAGHQTALVKKPRSAKQIEAFERARKKRDENRRLRAEEKAQRELQQKKEVEDKIIQKAISIKKKQILKQTVLDEISDEETPMEVIKEKIRAPRNQSLDNLSNRQSIGLDPTQPQIQQPKFTFF